MAQLIKVAEWPGKPRGHAVFVHGLGGHAYNTWRRGADDDSFWPAWLARDIDGLTVWTLSFEAPATNWLGTASPLQDRAVTVLELLLSEPELADGLADAPVTFICHSLGGLVVKQMLRAANDQRDDRPAAAALLERVKAVVFIATPHIGSAHASLLDWLRLIAWPSTAARDLVRNDANLRNLNVWYRNWSGGIAHRIFYEMQGTAGGTIVDAGSADAGLAGIVPIGIDADHIGICKPSGPDDLLYKSTRDFLGKAALAKAHKRSGEPAFSALPQVAAARPNSWAPIALRFAVLVIITFIGFKGVQATFFPGDPLEAATVQQIEQALRIKHPDLTSDQIERFIASLREARGDPSFDKAVAEVAIDNTLVAEGILKQIYEDREKQENVARKDRAKAARNLAAIVVVRNIAEGLSWYREATTLDPQNMEGWFGLGEAARSAGTTEEAERAFRRYIALARTAGDVREEAVGYNGLGDVQVAQGDLAAALDSYRASLAIIDRLAAADPTNADWQRDLSVSLGRIGHVQDAQDDLAAALDSYRASLAIRERLAAADPNNADWQRDLSVSHNNIGDVQVAQGDLAAALDGYRASLAIRERLAAADPNNADWQSGLWSSNLAIGDVLVTQGDLTGALQSFRASLAIKERLAAADPKHAFWQRDLSASQDRIGDVLVAQGDLTSALQSYRASLAIRKRLVAADPKLARWQRNLSVSQVKIGAVLVAQGDLTGALQSFRASLTIRKRLAAADPKHIGWQRDLSASQDRIGDMLVAQDDLTSALQSYRASLAIRKRLVATHPKYPGLQRELLVSHSKIGDVQGDQGDLTAALDSYRASHAIAERLASADPNNAGWQRDLAWLHWRLAKSGAPPQEHLQRVVEILKALETEGRLAPADRKWLPIAEQNLEAATR